MELERRRFDSQIWNSAKQNPVLTGKCSQFVMEISLSRNFYGTNAVLRKSFFPEAVLLSMSLTTAPFNYRVSYQSMQVHWSEPESGEVSVNLSVDFTASRSRP